MKWLTMRNKHSWNGSFVDRPFPWKYIPDDPIMIHTINKMNEGNIFSYKTMSIYPH